MKEENETFQLVPPHLHQWNSEERAIQTFKNHFISGMVSTHKYFPLHLWCRLLPQAIVTLNLLRPSRINPTLSAYAKLHGLFYFNATPFAPPGTKVIVHLKPKIRKSWAPILTPWCPTFSDCWLEMNDYLSSRWCKRSCVEIKQAMELCMC